MVQGHSSQGDGAGVDGPRVLAISDLHAGQPENRAVVDRWEPGHPGDWLIVAGDVADTPADVVAILASLRARFAKVIWVPGNHELLAAKGTPPELRGAARYRHLVQRIRAAGIVTPEDPYPVWQGAGGPVVIAPMFLLYDYGFGRHLAANKAEGLKRAEEARIVAVDEYLLDPEPYDRREDWCWARVALTEERLEAIDPALPTVLVNHWPLIEAPTRVLRYPEFAQWCGTPLTADWHTRFRAITAVYGHLHIPRTTWAGETRFEEVSLGYPREWKRRGGPGRPRVILPPPGVRVQTEPGG